MTSETKKFVLPLFAIYFLTALYWFFFKVPYYQYLFLFLGLTTGAYFLDLDHLIYWLYTNPHTEESRLARLAIFKYDFRSVVKLIQSTQYQHTSLIFHHFFFQVVVSLISFFVFTSSDNIFGMAFLLAINSHLLIHEYHDYRFSPLQLQDWLFAREERQLPANYLGKYIAVFMVLNLLFFILLLRSVT
ncbi:MAG: hypothetical protein WAV41_03550 [Microgenomates group bacterium]